MVKENNNTSAHAVNVFGGGGQMPISKDVIINKGDEGGVTPQKADNKAHVAEQQQKPYKKEESSPPAVKDDKARAFSFSSYASVIDVFNNIHDQHRTIAGKVSKNETIKALLFAFKQLPADEQQRIFEKRIREEDLG